MAAYLSYIELGENEAVCGVVGDCNVVQQSEYATFLDLLPVGVIGIIGYILILGAWVLAERSTRELAQKAQVALLIFTLIGAVFSVYLTFLEPFVIGATCSWCLTSALLMSLLLVIQAPSGWQALHAMQHHSRRNRLHHR